MNASAAQLTEEALHLPEDQRITLAHKLLSSVEPPETSYVEAAWNSEIQQRLSGFQQGMIKTVPAHEVFAELDARFK